LRNFSQGFAIRALGAFILSLLLVFTCAAQSTAPVKNATPVATVDGQAVRDDYLIPYVQTQLRPLREQEYQIKKKALDTVDLATST
jgi:hypothetical protein